MVAVDISGNRDGGIREFETNIRRADPIADVALLLYLITFFHYISFGNLQQSYFYTNNYFISNPSYCAFKAIISPKE